MIIKQGERRKRFKTRRNQKTLIIKRVSAKSNGPNVVHLLPYRGEEKEK